MNCFRIVWIAWAMLLALHTVHAEPIPMQKWVDLDGTTHTLANHSARATVVVFLATECPIGNRYIPRLNELAETRRDQGVSFFAVISDPTLTRPKVANWRDEFKLAWPVLFDSSGLLASQFAPTRTPEAFLLDNEGKIVYRGRIDDGFVRPGQVAQVIKSHDLVDAIDALLAGRSIAQAKTEPVGCLFEAWNHKSGAAGEITYARDIAPILNANCVSCHRAGEIAPFPLTSYDDAAKRAAFLAEVTESRYMPPWKPAANFGRFVGEHRLTSAEIDLLKRWAQAGAPRGNDADLPASPVFDHEWTLGKPDLVIQMPEAFTIPADGPDLYRAFVVPLNLPEETYIAGIEFRPGAKSVVHHAILYLDINGVARRLDEQDPAPGYSTFGGPGFRPSGTMGGWAPGATHALLPDGIGRRIRAGSDLVFHMHYHPDGRERQDQSSVAIYFQKKPITKRLVTVSLMTLDINIPPGRSNYNRDLAVTLPADMTLVGIIPHMHLVGREMKVHATAPSGEQIPLIWIPDWDFKWQGQYRFAKPITLKRGTTIHMTARYDNSADNPNNPNHPPRRIRFGEETTDEMCICFIEYLADANTPTRLIRQEFTRQVFAEAMRKRFKSLLSSNSNGRERVKVAPDEPDADEAH